MKLCINPGSYLKIIENNCKIICLEGHIWITYLNSDDIIIQKGEEYQLNGQKAWIQAFCKSVISIQS